MLKAKNDEKEKWKTFINKCINITECHFQYYFGSFNEEIMYF